MAQPLYFLPDINRAQVYPGNKLTRSVIEGRGLLDVFSDCLGVNQAGVADVAGRGPGGMSGTILHYQSPVTDIPGRIGFYPDEQDWHAVGDGSGYWIGLSKASPPTPNDLRRPVFHAGYQWVLGDGSEWTIPVIRRPDGTTNLPCDMIWDAAGVVQSPIKRAYERYWQDSEIVADYVFQTAGKDGELQVSRALELAVQAIGINYRFGRAEQNILRLVDTTNFADVLFLSVDFPKFSELVQKKTATHDTSITSPGCEGSAGDTVQVAATCD